MRSIIHLLIAVTPFATYGQTQSGSGSPAPTTPAFSVDSPVPPAPPMVLSPASQTSTDATTAETNTLSTAGTSETGTATNTFAFKSKGKALTFKEMIAVQTLLDRNNFSVGQIDGSTGGKTTAAVKAWQTKSQLPVTGQIDDATLQSLGDPSMVFTTYTVTAEDGADLAQVPKTWKGKSEQKQLGYETVLEKLSERFHLSEKALKKLNVAAKWPTPAVGTVLTVPSVGPASGAPVSVAVSALEINQKDKTVTLRDTAGGVIGMFPCTIAKQKGKQLTGEHQIVNIVRNPDYTFDPELFKNDSEEAKGMKEKLTIPAGANGPVGTTWIGLNKDGFGIHGTPNPELIGKAASHGCIRLTNWDAEKVAGLSAKGMPVRIVE
ncbi:MAG: L,D-transpeptidase family protein [Verrucomicrobiota bacterium]|nr:L,D-transpeptidase family protein [Verrucomicrobiota bacterium]